MPFRNNPLYFEPELPITPPPMPRPRVYMVAGLLGVVVFGCGRTPAPTPRHTVPLASPHSTTATPQQAVRPAVVLTSPAPSTRPIAVPIAADPAAHPEAYVPGATPPAFDRDAYLKDPAAYCRASVPGRTWQVAQPDATIPFLEPVGPTGFACATGKRVVLQAKTEPGMPVSFTSQGLGTFVATGLTAVTAAADQDGIARTEFAITPGTTGYVQITAGSPVRAGTIQYLITVTE